MLSSLTVRRILLRKKLIELVMALEEDYSIEIPADDLTNLTTVGSVIDYLKDKGVEA